MRFTYHLIFDGKESGRAQVTHLISQQKGKPLLLPLQPQWTALGPSDTMLLRLPLPGTSELSKTPVCEAKAFSVPPEEECACEGVFVGTQTHLPRFRDSFL